MDSFDPIRDLTREKKFPFCHLALRLVNRFSETFFQAFVSRIFEVTTLDKKGRKLFLMTSLMYLFSIKECNYIHLILVKYTYIPFVVIN